MKQYYIDLIGRIWKALPIYEKSESSFLLYAKGIRDELWGSDVSELIAIGNKLNFLCSEKIDQPIVRKHIFECISLIDKKLSNWV